jgi:glycosyltransferase involved in cell wall biosynthesis
LDSVDVFVVQSEFQKERFVRNGISQERIEILPGMAPVTTVPEQVPLGQQVVFVGRISPEKGVRVFVKAAGLLPNIPFAIAGDPCRMPGICDGTPSNIEWLGFIEGRALCDLYRRSRMVVVPSCWFEGFPNVLLQAMAFAKPIICSRIGALPEIIEGGKTGILVPPSDAGALTEAIRYLWNRPQLCEEMGRAGRRKLAQEYSTGRCYRRLMAIYAKATELRSVGANQACGTLSERVEASESAPSIGRS